MAKIHIPKSENTIKKEERKAKIDNLKKKTKVTNDELKELLLEILELLEV